MPPNLAPVKQRRIILTTFGSFGDLHPYLAIARGLQARGVPCAVATSASYREKVEALGIDFLPMRPDPPDYKTDRSLMAAAMDSKKGTERIIRDMMFPALKDAYEDLSAAVRDDDVLVSHQLTYATRLVAEKHGIAWVSSVLQPIALFSSYDPPVIAQAPWLHGLRHLGPDAWGFVFRAARLRTWHWNKPWHAFRAELGLPKLRISPIFEAAHAPALVLALFSRELAQPQPDWPSQTVVTGFPFFDHDGDPELPTQLQAFLDTGDPPIVLTLGTAAVYDPGRFFEHGLAAARALGRRVVLLTGKDSGTVVPTLDPAREIAIDYAPYSRLFPRASIIVHQGGVGTTGQAMLAGRPMLVMPYAHDQPDNAARVTRLGIGSTISRRAFNSKRVRRELAALLENPSYASEAVRIGARVAAEDGVASACDALLAVCR